MLKVLLLRKKLEALQTEETNLRSKLEGYLTREGELAKQVEAAKTDEELAAAAAAVEELEKTQKSAKERLTTIKEECDALLQEIEEAEAAGADAGTEGTEEGSQERSRGGASFQRRCQEFQRTGRMRYDNLRSLIRTAVTSATNGVVGPTGVGGINDAAGNTISGILDLIKITNCTGMASYKVAYMDQDPTAADGTEGTIPGESEPTFGMVELKPTLVNLICYISREIRKQSPLLYEQKVQESVRRALRRILSEKVIKAAVASKLNTAMTLTGTTGAELFTPHLLSDIILAYGGDEGVDGAACLILSKDDLKAFAAVRGSNEYLPVYSITPDASNPSCGVIKDNNGLSCRYCLNKNVTSLAKASLSGSAKKTMLYGNPQSLEMGLWGDLEVVVNDGYKFGEGLLTILGETMADADVTVKNGFVIVEAKTA